MIINYIQNENIFETDCDTIFNPTNSVGIMGAGLAKEFIKRYPSACNKFNRLSKSFQEINPGELIQPKIYRRDDNCDKNIVMFPTKIHWKDPSRYSYITKNLNHLTYDFKLINLVHGFNIKNLAIPKLGCGLGGLDWNRVKNVILEISKEWESIERIDLYE